MAFPVDPRSISRAQRQRKGSYPAEGGYGSGGVANYGPGTAQQPQYASFNMGSAGLQRDPNTFANALFGPGVPMVGPGLDQLNDDGLVDPRRYEYPVAWNLPHGVPGSEGYKLASFDNLRSICDMYSVANACIDTRISEIRGLEWDIVPTKEAEKDMASDHAAHKDFQERRAEAMRFWKRPDTDYADHSTWLAALLYDVFQVDALSLYMAPTRMKGKGLLGSDLAELQLIDGTSIRPMIDVRGARPKPPNVAYQQYLYGVPRTDLMTPPDPETFDDIEMVAEYRSNQLLYLPYVPRRWTPYGFPPVERALIPVMTGLYRQQFQLDYFNEGSIPGVFISPGDTNMTVGQMHSLQDSLNALAGDSAHKHRVVVLPPGSRVDPQKPTALADQFDEIVMSSVCMAFNVLPVEIGITPRVSMVQSSSTSNMQTRAANSIIERKALKPLLMWLKSAIFDYILQDICGQSDMEWQWEGMEQGLDEATQVSILVSKINAGLLTIDEGRNELGEQPFGLPMTTEPLVATSMGYLALGSIDPSTGKPEGLQPNAEAGSIAPPGEAPPDSGGGAAKPKPKPNPGASGASAGAAASDRAVGSKPGAGEGNGGKTTGAGAKALEAMVTKAALAELDALRRRLKQGKSIEDWECRAIEHGVLDAMVYALQMGEDPLDVVEKARQSVTQSRREAALAPIKDSVAAELGKAVNGLRTGRIGGPEFISRGVAAMTDGTSKAMRLGASHAMSDLGHPGSHRLVKFAPRKTPPVDFESDDYEDLHDQVGDYWDEQAEAQAQDGRHFLEKLMRDVTAAGATTAAFAGMAGRLDLYGQQAQSSYEQAYGITRVAAAQVEASSNGDDGVTLDDGTDLAPGEQMITWSGGDCALCAERDGEQYTIETLPGWPGDGFFGELCEGGPNCNCDLSWDDVTAENGIKLDGYAAERAALASDQQERMQQVNDLRQTFVDNLPSSVQADAQARDDARQQIATEMGAHQGYTAWPEDVAASDVRDRLSSGQ